LTFSDQKEREKEREREKKGTNSETGNADDGGMERSGKETKEKERGDETKARKDKERERAPRCRIRGGKLIFGERIRKSLQKLINDDRNSNRHQNHPHPKSETDVHKQTFHHNKW